VYPEAPLESRKSKVKNAFVSKLALLATVTLACVGIAELVIRIALPQSLSIWSHTRDGLVIHRAHIRGHMTPDGVRVDTNSIGMRDDEHARTASPDTFRILLFGDSFMEALQVDWEDTLAARLAARLNEARDQEIEILNASVSGWGTDDQLTYYLRKGRAFDPDLILVGVTLHNDVADNLLFEFHGVEDGALVERPIEEIPIHTYARLQVQEWLASSSHLYRLLVGSFRAQSVRAGAMALSQHVSELVRRVPSDRVQVGWAVTTELLDKMHEAADAGGAEMAVFLIPLAIQVTEGRLDAFLAGTRLGPSDISLEAPQEIMSNWGETRGVKVIDLLPDFRAWAAEHDADPYLLVDGHWSEDGHELGAEVVARELIGSGLIRGMPASR